MLLQKFRGLATTKLPGKEKTETSLYNFVQKQQMLLRSFYKFKKQYELFLIPFSSALGVTLTFEILVPGGVNENWTGVIVAFIITLISCITGIRSENKKSFKEPIQELQKILDEFNLEP